MIRFNNDYNHGAHPEILEALASINGNSYGGYGEDEWCENCLLYTSPSPRDTR